MRLILIRDYSDWTVDRFNVIRTDIEPQLIVEARVGSHSCNCVDGGNGHRWRLDF